MAALPLVLSLHRRQRGQAVFYMALTMFLAVVGGVMVIDVGLLYGERVKAQRTADLAALAGALELPIVPDEPAASIAHAEAQAVALDYLEGNGYDPADPDVTAVVTPGFDAAYDAIEVRIAHRRSWVVGRVFGLDSVTVSVRAVAERKLRPGAHYAFLSLNETVCKAFDKGGSANLDVGDGGIMVNSSCVLDAVNVQAGGDIYSDEFHHYYEGGVDIGGSATVDPMPSPVSDRVPDPLADLAPPDLGDVGISPDSGGTALAPSTLSVGGITALHPGVFYGGIQIAAGGVVTLQPGTYVMAGGGFKSSGSGGVIGNGVFIYNTDAPEGSGPDAGCELIDLSGSGDVVLSPPASGVYNNILFFQDRSCSEPFKYTGGKDSTLGVIYIPSGPVDIAGGGGLGSVQFIADTFDINGSGDLTVDFYPWLEFQAEQIGLVQ